MVNPELVQHVPEITTGLSLLVYGMAFRKKDRDRIVERDEGKSQLQQYDEEKGWNTDGYCADGGVDCNRVHVHHIKPQRTGGKDEARNAITLFECQHTGRCSDNKIEPKKAHWRGKKGRWVSGNEFVVHRDMQQGLMNYDPSRDSFKDVFDARDEAVKRGETYWDDTHDEQMRRTAEERSQNPKWWQKKK